MKKRKVEFKGGRGRKTDKLMVKMKKNMVGVGGTTKERSQGLKKQKDDHNTKKVKEKNTQMKAGMKRNCSGKTRSEWKRAVNQTEHKREKKTGGGEVRKKCKGLCHACHFNKQTVG